jgi:predicted component of type VI protein secretion system
MRLPLVLLVLGRASQKTTKTRRSVRIRNNEY